MKTYNLEELEKIRLGVKRWAVFKSPTLAVNPMNMYKKPFLVLPDAFEVKEMTDETDGTVDQSWKIFPLEVGSFELEYGFKDIRTMETLESFKIDLEIESKSNGI